MSELVITELGNPIPNWSSFGGQNKSHGNSPAVSVGGNVKQDIDPMLSPDNQNSGKGLNLDLGSLLSYGSGIATNVASAQEAQKQRDWQERMQNTAWQRQAKDLQKVGLNRILGYTKGQQASTPSGGIAQMKDPMASSLAARRLNQELKNLKAQEAKTQAETRNELYKSIMSQAGASTSSVVIEILKVLGVNPETLLSGNPTINSAKDAELQAMIAKDNELIKKIKQLWKRTTP